MRDPYCCAALFTLLLVSCLIHDIVGFATVQVTKQATSGTALRIGNIFDGLGQFFSSDDNEDGDAGVEEDDDDYLGRSCLISLPVESIKPGGLRLFLMFYLLGVQNTPEKGTWRIDQPTADEYVVDMYFHDRTAAIMLTLTEEKVTIDRMGSTPSTAYIMQETVAVDGILEELQKMATDVEINREDRLILLTDENAIVNAREALSFG